MSKRLLSFLLSELGTTRIICQHCKGVFELPVERVAEFFGQPICKFCEKNLGVTFNNNHIVALAEAITNLKHAKANQPGGVAEIEFTLPDTN